MSRVTEWVLRRKAEVDAGLHQKEKAILTVRLCDRHVKILEEVAKRAGISKTKAATEILEASIDDCFKWVQQHEKEAA